MTAAADLLDARNAGDVTTLCHAWRVTLADGGRLGFTDHDKRLVIDGLEFEPYSGMTASEARDSAGLGVDTAEISGALTSDRINEADIAAGRFDGAIVETLLVDWTEPAAHRLLRTATIGRIERADGAFTAELDSMARGYDQPRGRYFRRKCDAEIGDPRCGIDPNGAAFSGVGQVNAISADGVVRVTGLDGFEEGWFTGGRLTPEGGAVVRVTGHARRFGAVELTLASGVGFPVSGTGFAITAGCDKSFSVCRTKFDNSLNFRGFPHLPGNDAVYAYVTEDAVFDGAPLVP